MGRLLNGSEFKFFDSIAVELMELAGTNDPVLWKFFKYPNTGSVSGYVDCLYEEPVGGSKHYTPFNVLCWFDSKDRGSDATDQGLEQIIEGQVWFVRKNLEDKKVPLDEEANHIQEGDIIQLWSKNKLRTWFFEIINVNREGWENDSDVFTHYTCNVIRRTSFVPEKKIVK